MRWLHAVSNSFWGDLAVHVLAAVLIVIAGHLVFHAAHAIHRFIQLRRAFNIGGSWIGTCKLPSYPDQVEAIEIYRFVVKTDLVDFCFFNYRPDSTIVEKHVGAGACRGHLLSVYYYAPKRKSAESGVFVARLVGHVLKGMYAQYDPTANETLYVSDENFTLRRISLNLKSQVRLVLGIKPVGTHAEALELYRNAH